MLDAIQQQIVDDFSVFDDWSERYAYLMELGETLPPFPEEDRKPELLVRGCQSQVWLTARFENGRVHFVAMSDSAIVCGLIALLWQVYNNQTPDYILQTEPAFIEAIGLSQHLSPNRKNGLFAMFQKMREWAKLLQVGANGVRP